MKKYYHLGLIILLITYFSSIGFSQSEVEYYKPAFNEGLTLNTNTYYTVFGMQAEYPNDSIEYVANNPLGVSVGLSHPKIPIGITVGYGIKATLNPNELRTKSLDIQIHNYGNKYVFDVAFQRYKGFYAEDFDIDTKNINHQNLSAMSISAVGQYVFNNKRFSYRAAYNRKEIQIKSAGTFLVGAGIYYFDVMSKDFPIYESESRVKSLQIGLNGGYSYSFVKNNWLLNGSLSGGANLSNGNIVPSKYKKLYLKPTALARMSIFYNAQRWSIGVMGVYSLGLPIYTKDVRMKIHSARFDISFLYRFDKIKRKKDKVKS